MVVVWSWSLSGPVTPGPKARGPQPQPPAQEGTSVFCAVAIGVAQELQLSPRFLVPKGPLSLTTQLLDQSWRSVVCARRYLLDAEFERVLEDEPDDGLAARRVRLAAPVAPVPAHALREEVREREGALQPRVLICREVTTKAFTRDLKA